MYLSFVIYLFIYRLMDCLCIYFLKVFFPIRWRWIGLPKKPFSKLINLLWKELVERFTLLIFSLFHVSIQVVALLCTGSLRLLWMFKLSPVSTLMLLLTKEWMTLGVSRVSMEILIQPTGKTPGFSFELWATAPRCLGCVWVTSMNFCLRMRNRVGWIDRRDKCKVSGMLWIIAGFRILVLMGTLSLGATVKQVTKTLGFIWIGVWQL